MENTQENQQFYWQIARDSLLTPAALSMFQLAIKYDGHDFNASKDEIDRQYEIVRGRGETQRHGGNFQTFIRVFEESGWITLREHPDGTKTIFVTEAGYQANQILNAVPDYLKAVPFFLIELFSRYQINNPSGPEEIRNQEINRKTRNSNIFPYWTIWKIMRSCNNRISTDELKRFVFRLHRTEQIDQTIASIKSYRRDLERGLPMIEINRKYKEPLAGAVGEPKYIMARAGTHIGKYPPLIQKLTPSIYELNPTYFSLIDEVIINTPIFKDYLDNETWMRDYGRPIEINSEEIPFADPNHEIDEPLGFIKINDDHPIWIIIQNLIANGSRNILFTGAPGTSKTTYAAAIGAKLVDHQAYRFFNLQFHQSFSYEDFVEGYIPSEATSPSPFELKEKVFLQACKNARKEPEKLYVLVIDELNRGDPSRIFGEALTYIERRDEHFQLASGRRAIVPNNLVILATMNPFDKSISDLDMAMDRRFDKIQLNPDRELLRDIVIKLNGMDTALAGELAAFFDYLMAEVENRIGHAYFKDAKDLESLIMVWDHKILPVLEKELRYTPEKLARIDQDFRNRFHI